MRRNKKRDSVKLFMLFTSLVITTICVASVLSIVWISQNADSLVAKEEAYEASWISNGLAIIGIAVAIWAGLDIIQVIEKGKIEQIARQVGEYEIERKSLYRGIFLEELSKGERPIQRYLYNLHFSTVKNNDNISSDIYRYMILLNSAGNSAYKKEVNAVRTFDKTEFELVKLYLSEIENYINDKELTRNSEKYVKTFIACIKADIFFDFGYDEQKDYRDSIKFFEQVIELYGEVYPKLIDVFSLNDSEKRRKLLNPLKRDIDLDVAIYILNSAAEAYSKIGHIIMQTTSKNNNMTDKVKDRLKEEALSKLKTSKIIYKNMISEWEGKYFFEEFVYRNYGASIERIIRIEQNNYGYLKNALTDIKEIILIKENYDKAMSIAFNKISERSLKEGVFAAWGTLYERIMRNTLYVSDRTKLMVTIDNLNRDLLCPARNWTKDACAFMHAATKLYPMKTKYLKLYGIALVYQAIFLKLNNEDGQSQYIFNEAELVIDAVNSICKYTGKGDDYFNHLMYLKHEFGNL